jgi:amino acid adenylation domain-containing protein
VLQGVLRDPERPVGRQRLLPPEERAMLLETWNATDVPREASESVHVVIDGQARRRPSKVAARLEGASLTYADLADRSDRVARHLTSMGVKLEDRVGVFLEPSPEMVVALLGVLKAGCAYVPLPVSSPRERRDFIMRDADVRIVITREDLAPALSGEDVPLVFIDESKWHSPSSPSDRGDVAGDQLAYVIYTSGSSGRPKGVQCTHRGLTNLLRAVQERLNCGAQDEFLSVTTPGFDIAALEIFLPLMLGARVTFARRADVSDPMRLRDRIAETRPTVMQATPTMWRALLDAGWEGYPELVLLSGGEVLSEELADRLRPNGSALWNMYGPTETTIWSSMSKVEAKDGPASIGRPVANTRFHVLDEHMEPVPVGVAGELYVGGMGLARGYANAPARTADGFVPDPFGPPGSRLYRTGDRARYRASGEVEYLGRTDRQVKLRGHRIEPGEVEAVLEMHARVHEAAVVVRGAGEASRLVGFTTGHANGEELRRWLRERLPDYMVPAQLVQVAELPRTESGKLDRGALPEVRRLSPTLTHVAPRTGVEAALVELWEELLEIEGVGIHDDFFEVGGHSLLATQLAWRIREVFDVEVPLRTLFENATIASQAEYVENKHWVMTTSKLAKQSEAHAWEEGSI